MKVIEINPGQFQALKGNNLIWQLVKDNIVQPLSYEGSPLNVFKTIVFSPYDSIYEGEIV